MDGGIRAVFDHALKLHQNGEIQQAEELYRQVLAHNPHHADALHLLGVAALQRGVAAESESLIRRAIAISPQSALYHGNLGRALLVQGKFAESEASSLRALSLRPEYPDALHNLGVAYQQTSRPFEAVALFRQAIQLRPTFAESYRLLGAALRETGQTQEAIATYEQAIRFDPADAQALNNLGAVFEELGRLDEAITCYRKAIAVNPNFAQPYYNLGNAMKGAGKTAEAIELFQRAIALQPLLSECHNNLGICYQESGRVDDAIRQYGLAIEQQPNSDLAYKNLGNALSQKREFVRSYEAFEQALKLNPLMHEARFDRSLSLLLQGKLAEGWSEYEFRQWVRQQENQHLAQPVWDGTDLGGARILIQCEQGLGDAIQFIRYVPLVKRKGGVVTVLCRPELRRLLVAQVEIDDVACEASVDRGFGVRCPLLSLPRIFGTTLETIPTGVPYLRAAPKLISRWQERLQGVKGLKIGLAWAGNPEHGNDRNRSLPLSTLAPLIRLPNFTWVSLQKGRAAEPSNSVAVLHDWTREIDDLADTAALIQNLDIVISCDTAVAHLAGALGKPVWVMLPYNPDWRWLLDRPDSPWYPRRAYSVSDGREIGTGSSRNSLPRF